MTDVVRFIRTLTFDDLPEDTVQDAIRCTKDLIGVAASGTATDLSRIICDHVVENFAAGPTRQAGLVFDGRQVSPTGAALANAMTIDSVDAHDGHPECKGHVGVGILAACLALPGAQTSGREFLTRMILGYELGSRLGQALHGTVSDYHTSGAWCALANAALCGRALGLTEVEMRHALGIAEYHGPRSQMMRVIDHPTMLKDGSGWGAMCGVSAALLAADGFTGAPALLVESDTVAPYWADLGQRWMIRDQYLKPDPVCRWAQPPVKAVRDLKARTGVAAEDIAHIEVETFHEAVRLAARTPADTEQAQYSLPWPVAIAAVHGAITVDHIVGDALQDPAVLRLSTGMKLIERDDYNARFPSRRFADVTLVLKDGTRLESGPTEAHGGADSRLSDAEISAKFRLYAGISLDDVRIVELEREIDGLANASSIEALCAMLRV